MSPDVKEQFRTSTAKRRLPTPGRLSRALLFCTVVAICLVIAVFELGRSDDPVPPPPQLPSPTIVPEATATASPSPTATPFWEQHELTTEVPTPSPTPFPSPTATPYFEPTPTPGILDCLDMRWSASASRAASGQVLITVNVNNRCRRDIEIGEVWFSIAGYRDGSVVQSTRGQMMKKIRRGHSDRIVVGLPGSLSWYDKITVKPYEGTAVSIRRK